LRSSFLKKGCRDSGSELTRFVANPSTKYSGGGDCNSNGRLDSYNKVSDRRLRHKPRLLGTVYHPCPPIWRTSTPSMRAGVSVCRPSYGAFGISLRAIRRTLVVFETPSKILASSNAGKLRRSKLSIMPYSIVSIPSRWRRELEV